MMDGLNFHLASGQSFFTGIGLVLGVALLNRNERPLKHSLSAVALVVGIISIAVSSTAISSLWYLVATFLTVIWLSGFARDRYLRWLRWAVMVVCCVGVALEAPFYIGRSPSPVDSSSLTVIGDSLTAGIGDETTWTTLLARKHGLTVHDFSYPGDTTGLALRRLSSKEISSPIVIIEIGGNDLLGGTRSEQYRRDLESLLKRVSRPGRQIVMFELPLLPLHHQFGRIQRELAKKYQVILVPKRVLISVLSRPEATVDEVHLSESGHQLLADKVWKIVAPAFGE